MSDKNLPPLPAGASYTPPSLPKGASLESPENRKQNKATSIIQNAIRNKQEMNRLKEEMKKQNEAGTIVNNFFRKKHPYSFVKDKVTSPK